MRFLASILLVGAVLLPSLAASEAANSPADHTGMDDHYRDELLGESEAPHPDWVAENIAYFLKRALKLSAGQTSQIELILKRGAGDVLALGAAPPPAALAAIRQRMRDQIRPLLTEEQRARFNLISQQAGGGLVGMSPWDQVNRLDQLVHLTPAQKKAVLDEYIDLVENLMEAQAPEQAAQAKEVRKTIKKEIRALLTPEQRKLWDATPAKKVVVPRPFPRNTKWSISTPWSTSRPVRKRRRCGSTGRRSRT